MKRAALGRGLANLMPAAKHAARRPIVCKCGRLHPDKWVKPKGKPGRWACGWCREALGRSDPWDHRPGVAPDDAPLVVPET